MHGHQQFKTGAVCAHVSNCLPRSSSVALSCRTCRCRLPILHALRCQHALRIGCLHSWRGMHDRVPAATFVLSCVCTAMSDSQQVTGSERAPNACACAAGVTGCWLVPQARLLYQLVDARHCLLHQQLSQYLQVTAGRYWDSEHGQAEFSTRDSPTAALRTPAASEVPPLNVSQLSLSAFTLHRPVAQQLLIGPEPLAA